MIKITFLKFQTSRDVVSYSIRADDFSFLLEKILYDQYLLPRNKAPMAVVLAFSGDQNKAHQLRHGTTIQILLLLCLDFDLCKCLLLFKKLHGTGMPPVDVHNI